MSRYYRMDGAGEWSLQDRWADVAALGPFAPNDWVLDIGCAEGLVSAEVAQRVSHVRAVDIDGERVEMARRAHALEDYPNLDFGVQSAGEAARDASGYDVVLLLGVLQHLGLVERRETLRRALRARRAVLIRCPFETETDLESVRGTCRKAGFTTMLICSKGKAGHLLLANRTRRRTIVSYPKCGRTWLRMAVAFARVVHDGRSLDTLSGSQAIEVERTWADWGLSVTVTHDKEPHKRLPGAIAADKSDYYAGGAGVVFLVRDPRDVMVSLWLHGLKRDPGMFPGVKTLQDMLDAEQGGLRSLAAFWASWAPWFGKVRDATTLIRYAECCRSPAQEFGRLLTFLGIPHSREQLARLVEELAFERMQARQAAGQFDDAPALAPGKRKDPDSCKIRRGKVGGYRDYMTPAQIKQCTAMCRALPEPFRTFYANG